MEVEIILGTGEDLKIATAYIGICLKPVTL